MSVAALLRDATAALKNSAEQPEREAQLLLAFVTQQSRASLLLHADRSLDNETITRFNEAVARRAIGEPIAYIVGYKEFWSLELRVTRATLIPRPETETLVERALQLIPQDQPCRIADLGTGSGAIALAIAHERPQAHVIATDQSAAALDVARDNAQRLNIHNVEFRHGDWFDCLEGERFSVIASNPPYVSADDPHLQCGDLRFEPRSALTCDTADDLAAIRHLVQQAQHHLTHNGWLLLEHGYDQGARVTALLNTYHYQHVEIIPDLNNIPRVAVAHVMLK